MFILQGESYKREPGKAIDAPIAPQTTILDHERAFWMKFVDGNGLSIARLEPAGYTAEQAVWIESEMRKLGWL